jgi:hypothetical protein
VQSPGTSRILAYFLLVLAYALGCASLGLFGLFLWAGPHPVEDLGLAAPLALSFDALLAIAFFVQHSGMIRKSFRTRLSAVLPDYYQPVVYAIASGVVLLLLPVLWQPSRLTVLVLDGPLRWLARGVFLAAMAGILWSFGSAFRSDWRWASAGASSGRTRAGDSLHHPRAVPLGAAPHLHFHAVDDLGIARRDGRPSSV